MKTSFKMILGFLPLLGGLIFLQGCELQNVSDPFEVEPAKEETLSGEVFSFDISVATKATHRLEKDGKLVALLASDIIDLESFEGRKVSLSGVFKTEKMREIFWVKSLELTELTVEEQESGKTHERFLAKAFSFVFPASWEYSTSPDGTVYFSEKNDIGKRIFLNFSVGTMTSEDRKKDPNVLIAGLSGYKKPNTETETREQQDITLFSNISSQKFRFLFTSQFEDFEKKKQFFALLNSFIEGEEAVAQAKEKDLKEQAARLLEKIQKEEERKELEKLNEESQEKTEGAEEGLISKIIEKISDEKSEEKNEEELVSEIVEERTEEAIAAQWAYKNLIDGRAYPYASNGLSFSLKAPFGFWFRNFGGVEGRLGIIGFAKKDFSLLSESDFVLEILKKEGGISEKTMTEKDEELIIQFPRNGFENSFFQIRGNVEWKDAMLSVMSSVVSE